MKYPFARLAAISVSVSVLWATIGLYAVQFLSLKSFNTRLEADCVKIYALDVLLEAFTQAWLNWLFYILEFAPVVVQSGLESVRAGGFYSVFW